MFPFLSSGTNLTIFFEDGSSVIFDSEHPSYNLAKSKLINGTENEIKALANVEQAKSEILKTYSKGRASYSGGQVYLDGQPVHNTITQRINQFAQENLPFEHLLKFLENVSANPSYRAQQELYNFLEHQFLPITDDGHFLAYKAVRSDYKDKYSGTFLNLPGSTISIPRNKVDDDCDRGCSYGLHVGAIGYVRSYGNGHDDIILIVKVNPADVVSIPKDSSHQKCRTCSYTVLRVFEGELNRPLYNAAGNVPYQGSNNGYNDTNLSDYDDEDYYEREDEYYDDEDEEEDDFYDDEEEDDYEEDDVYDPQDVQVSPSKTINHIPSKQEKKYGPQLSSKELSKKAKKQRRDKYGHFIRGYKKS